MLELKENNESYCFDYNVRVYKLAPYEIFLTDRYMNDILVKDVDFIENKVYYQVNAKDKLELNDNGDFRLVYLDDRSAVFIYCDNPKNVDEEDMYIRNYLSGVLVSNIY